ncbi:MAG: excinuclease ABC subunit UvrA, partial [Deltaproteobacteria bacterium]|nr:excinuclease ABC subunit UvrA [Deltaproteobacteria bacterium]
MDKIIIKGARVHNLKGFDLEIPRDRLVVITGVSGSGKSSLAFDTIYAEGQRRYVESLSTYARQFLEQMDKPDVESIEGLSPAIAIEQKTTSKNPRSTVGTVTEIYDYLRLLYSRVGTPHCYKCDKPITNQSIQQMIDKAIEIASGKKVMVLSPIVRGRKGEYRKELSKLLAQGYTRAKIDGELLELDQDIALDKRKKHDIEVVIDRLTIKEDNTGRLAESFEAATALSGGLVRLEPIETKKKKASAKTKKKDDSGEMFFNEKLSCVKCSISYPELTPAMFSFNSPQGACVECNGIGEKYYFDPELIVPDKNLSLMDGAVLAWTKKGSTRISDWFDQILSSLTSHYGFDPAMPYKKLPKKIQEVLIKGSGEEEISFEYKKKKNTYTFHQPFEGVLPNLERRYHETESEDVRADLEKYMNSQPCPVCFGARLKKEPLCVKVDGKNIFDIVEMPIKKAQPFFAEITLDEEKQEIAKKILKEITERLGFLNKVGLSYLTLSRAASTLSGGEGQRIRLATQIGSSLVGVLYILDEPSIGLHQRDNQRLLDALKKLRDMGNSVIVVEHDEATINDADHVIDMGPGAGTEGGHVVSMGTPLDIIQDDNSITGKFLSGKLRIEVPKKRKKPTRKALTLKGCTENNLKNISASFPIGVITCVTGVSGSGKSTLVIDTLYKNLTSKLYGSKIRVGKCASIKGL